MEFVDFRFHKKISSIFISQGGLVCKAAGECIQQQQQQLFLCRTPTPGRSSRKKMCPAKK